ncbi:MAG: hypothetical protein NLN64_01065 [Candidatus Thalassarchaeaceae archaeon]|nr:hypothetical protein [Candidatus Thalassarchaeaceae archaeon]
MKTKKFVTFIMIMMYLNISFSGIVMGQEGGDILIESDVTWTENNNLESNIKIINGGKLTISNSEIIISTGLSINIESGGKLIIDNSTIISDNIPTNLVGYGYCDQYNRSTIIINEDLYNGEFEITILALDGTTFNGASAYINDEILEMSGEEFSYSFSDQNGDIEIGMHGYGCTNPITVSNIQILDEGVTNNYDAIELNHRNMRPFGNRNYEINIEGSLNSYNSSIIGGLIESSGDIKLFDSYLDRSGPILLLSDNSSITISGNSNFTNSFDDHDIRAMPESTINWEESAFGSGGLTDKWERRIKGQYLEFDAVYVEYQILGLYGVNKYTNFSNSEGISYIDGGRERIIEIAWSQDNIWKENEIWKENAIINVIKYRTAWNPENSQIENYGTYGISLDKMESMKIFQNTPKIEWVNLESENNIKNASGSIMMIAKIKNVGDAPAHIAITCYLNSTGEAAQTDSYPNTLINPDETGEILFNWQSIKSGNEQLNCKILTPTQLVNEDSFGGGSMTSSIINWESIVNEGGLSYIMPIIIALIFGIFFSGYIIVNNIKNKDLGYDKE